MLFLPRFVNQMAVFVLFRKADFGLSPEAGKMPLELVCRYNVKLKILIKTINYNLQLSQRLPKLIP